MKVVEWKSDDWTIGPLSIDFHVKQMVVVYRELEEIVTIDSEEEEVGGVK